MELSDEASIDSDGAVQLSLFPEKWERTGEGGRSESEEKALKALRQADVMNMTPLEALTFINEWKQKLNDA